MYDDGFDALYILPEKNIEGWGECEHEYIYIKPGKSTRIGFNEYDIGYNPDVFQKYRIRLTGEVDINPLWRTEEYFPMLYRLIDDSLCSDITHHSSYSLRLCSNSEEEYSLKACFKLLWTDIEGELPEITHCKDGQLKFGLWFKKQDIEIMSGGTLKLVAEVFLKKQGRYSKDISGPPDEVYSIDIGEGTCDWAEKQIVIDKKSDIDTILVYVEGRNFKGTAWIEDAYIKYADFPNFLPQFAPSTPVMRHFNWLGINLSRKEWPRFEVVLNDREIFEGELFQRIYRWPVSEIEVMSDVLRQGDNELIIKLKSDYREPLPYKLKKVEFVCQEDLFRVTACPRFVREGEQFSILLSVDNPMEMAIVTSSNPNIQPVVKEAIFQNAGLNVVYFNALKAGSGAEIFFKTNDGEHKCFIERVIEGEGDGVLTGTSDAVYVNNNIKDMERFIAWYLHHQIGNFITFRPVYRWSGSRVAKQDEWEKIAKLCSSMGTYYTNMIECRELPGSEANPDANMLKGSYYLGGQAHERDGYYCYWGSWKFGPEDDYEFFFDMLNKSAKINGNSIFKPPFRNEHGTFFNFDGSVANDMEQAAKSFVNGVSEIKHFAKRHTGPSAYFKYFYMAGVEWLGAELMYGPQEVLLSTLRGSSKAYGRNSFGAHLAVQWSTTPHDSEQRYRRYFLALYLCYMHGVKQIDTEEGLWRLEERFAEYERFSEPCTKHREVQENFYHFIQTHSRRGNIYTPMAFLHGQYDGWTCFGRGSAWRQNGEEWRFGAPEESWDLLKIFYPRTVVSAIYRHPCPNEPQGYYSGTPYGTVDIVPVEAEGDMLNSNYKILSFLGWNTADENQIQKMISFVQNGGTLLLGLPHIFSCKKRNDAFGENPSLIDNKYIRNLIGSEIHGYEDALLENNEKVKVGRLILNGAKVLAKNREGLHVVTQNNIGKGRVIFVNVKAYPAQKEVRDIYEGLLHELGSLVLETEKEKGWLNCSKDVGFTVYDNESDSDSRLRVIYFMNTNWWDDENSSEYALLLWGDRTIKLEVKRENINILTMSENWAAWVYDNETDVISMEEQDDSACIRLQGSGEVNVCILSKVFDNKSYELYLNENNGRTVRLDPGKPENSWNAKINLCGPENVWITAKKL